MTRTPHIVFELGPHPGLAGFAMEVGSVLRVIDLDVIVPVPLAPGPVRGIMNHNGRIVTLVDPAPLLGLPQQPVGGPAQVLLLRRDERRKGNLGLLVRSIHEIVSRSALERVEVQAGPCVSWVANVKHRLIHVVDLEPLLHGLSELFGAEERNEPLGVGL